MKMKGLTHEGRSGFEEGCQGGPELSATLVSCSPSKVPLLLRLHRPFLVRCSILTSLRRNTTSPLFGPVLCICHSNCFITTISSSFQATPSPTLAMGLEVDTQAGRVLILDGSTVRAFATDASAFNQAVDPQFHTLDVNGDGVLSRAELRPAFERLNLIDLHFGVPVSKTPAELTALYDSVFEDFDTDHNDTVDLNEFRSSLNQILLAIADGLGSAPLTMLVEDGSLLGDAADHETRNSLQASQIDAEDVPPPAIIQNT